MLLLAFNARAAEADDFQVLLQHSGLPESVHPRPGQALAADDAQNLWRGLLESPATLRTFAPRIVLARLVREALATGQPLAYDELLASTRRFRPLVVVRPDGYVSTALTGRPLARMGAPALRQGELYVLVMRVGAFYVDDGGVFFAVGESLQQQGEPVGERPLGRDPATAALLGAQDALEDVARGLAAFITHPVRTLAGLSQLPSAVAGLIASSPEYFEHFKALPREEQLRETARLATHLLILRGGSAAVGPRLASATRLPVLSLSSGGRLAVREVAVSAGTMTAVVGAGAVSVSIVFMAESGGASGDGPPREPWPPAPAGSGQWTQKEERMTEEAQRFQSRVTGAPAGWVYRVRTGPGPKDYVDFDGFKDGVLLEVKGPGYQKLLRKMHGKVWFHGVEDMLEQAKRQLEAARGVPIEWHFAEQEVADFMRALFEEKSLGRIKVV
ncbi:Tox-REase-5 domain-containing protein [Archangium sp.]|uniref:Tox-REase-5 domain-containing protein n=1 Tax=Archangium sp. TaxID=1872627 RepID=UPI00389A125B